MEYLDIVNESGHPTGETVSRDIAHRDGVPHRTAHVWVIRPSERGYDILLQKRSMEKESFPGLYDTSSAGHVPAGEEPLPSALRELREELGIIAGPGELDYVGSFHIQYEKVFHGLLFKDNEVTKVYLYALPVDIRELVLQKSEVDEVRWFDLDEVWDEIQLSRDRFCVPTAVLGFSLFWTFYSFLDTSGKYLREVYGYVPGQPGSFIPVALSYLTWIALACLTAFLTNLILDDENADLLLAIGSVILVAGMFSEFINTGLKIIACRPRYKYLITLDDPTSEYRNWWEMIPYLKDESNFRSWPSGHMTKATIMLALPMLADTIKCKKTYLKNLFFAFAVVWIVVLGYNRIHMNAHFLTDVCFGVLITYCLYALTYKLVFSVFEKDRQG